MTGYIDYYGLLNLPPEATEAEIRRNFRKLALEYHPDRNGNSTESHIIFNAIRQGYETLISEEKRSAYDAYLRSSTILKHSPVSNNSSHEPNAQETADAAAGQLNFILWEIEDILSKTDSEVLKTHTSGFTLEKWISCILSFIDQWILTPAGFGDHFFTARNIDKEAPYNPFEDRLSGNHLPYTDIFDYFYQIRRRMDKFLSSFTKSSLAEKLPGSTATMSDAVFEAVNLSFHYLSSIQQVLSGEKSTIQKYNFFDTMFTKTKIPFLTD